MKENKTLFHPDAIMLVLNDTYDKARIVVADRLREAEKWLKEKEKRNDNS